MLTFEMMWERVLACDAAYDGQFYTGVKTTKIYCRPSCRSRKPKRENVEFYKTRQEAETSGYRACKRCQPDIARSPSSALVHDVTTFLLEAYMRPLKLDDIAAHVNMSPFYVERTFTETTGETPRQRLERIRIDQAAYLLKTTDWKNEKVGAAVGLSTPSNFYRVFKRWKGASPNAYRKERDDATE